MTVRFDLSEQQSDIMDAVRQLLARHAGLERVQALGGDSPSYDSDLEDALEKSGFADLGCGPDTTPLDAALVAEAVAREVGVVAFGARTFVATGLGAPDLARPIAVTTAGHTGPVRYLGDASTLVVVDGDEAIAYTVEPNMSTPVPSRFGYPFSRLTAPLPDGHSY
ncbi:MAG TPA: hypothetical protein VGM78_16005, partial [Ilumatobacteraceae bacterium]